jgi:hypothetical protein
MDLGLNKKVAVVAGGYRDPGETAGYTKSLF